MIGWNEGRKFAQVRPGQIVVGLGRRGENYYRLVIEEIKDAKIITSYTRWVDAVQVRGAENQQVYLTFSSRFERIWLDSKKRLLDYVAQKPGHMGLRSRYALRLYSWAEKYVTAGTKHISLEQLRKVLGLDSVTDADGNVIREAPLQVWANLRQRALDPAIAEINKKTDLTILLESLGRSKHRRVTTLSFAIKAKAEENSEG
jgi:plasmid replication initiation protein